ncbi:Gfo/Idh/MocA family protein [Phyllobacterium pellucidum]|uniref:Gfo/Idh/MocA family protein n=1 Tax=Phyllobacterium pellucidum TaxID=2740464 RepID=UPI001D14F9E6|nr:Gfo/Idh/MocA family oxidoreductase [Phyllobacterium sp. T1018]UGY10711.1 Gfo/Idh/MocA family oxidoreductase [Phyllobacterium sp. T1018]
MVETGEKSAKAGAFGWGIIGSGESARRFASDLSLLPDAALVANHSRILSSAEKFRETFGGASAYADLDSFIADPAIDAVYIATPSSLHLAQALKALRSGKPVLIDRPLAPSHTEAAVIQREASRGNILAMEASSARFLPAVTAAKKKVDAGEIGAIRRITAELSVLHAFDAESRFFNRSLGGGAGLTFGLDCVSLAMHFLGQPQKVSGLWHAAPNGVDMRCEIALYYDEAEATLSSGLDEDGANHFVIEGAKGAIRIDAPFTGARSLTTFHGFALTPPFGPLPAARGLLGNLLARLPIPGRVIEDHPFSGTGLQFQTMAVMAAIRAGETGAELMPLADSINALRAVNIVLSQPATQRIIKL